MRVFFLLSSRHASGPPTDQQACVETPPRAHGCRRQFWQAVRNRNLDGFKFRFQHSLWPYIVDFACLEAMLIVELDGGQHSGEADAERTAALERQGFEVLRLWNREVIEHFDGVMEAVHAALLRRAAEKK